MADIAYIGADMVLRITGVEDQDGAPQSNATVVVSAIRLHDAPEDGTDFLGGPINGAQDTGGAANDYIVAFPATLDLADGTIYRAEGAVTLAAGPVLPFRHIFRATHFETPR